jgi:hypothetical protein
MPGGLRIHLARLMERSPIQLTTPQRFRRAYGAHDNSPNPTTLNWNAATSGKGREKPEGQGLEGLRAEKAILGEDSRRGNR